MKDGRSWAGMEGCQCPIMGWSYPALVHTLILNQELAPGDVERETFGERRGHSHIP